MAYKNTPANNRKREQYIAHYNDEVRALSTADLLHTLKNSDSLNTRSEIIKDAIAELCASELTNRGVQLPYLTALLQIR